MTGGPPVKHVLKLLFGQIYDSVIDAILGAIVRIALALGTVLLTVVAGVCLVVWKVLSSRIVREFAVILAGVARDAWAGLCRACVWAMPHLKTWACRLGILSWD